MSMLLSKNNSIGRSLMNELKKQASFFLRDKINTARLTLTDVTHAQLLTEEVTNGNPWSPDARTMAIISHAAFEVDDFWRITDILHKRLDWGLRVEQLSERVLNLLEDEDFIQDERAKARKVSREIKGLGSFWDQQCSVDRANFDIASALKTYERWNIDDQDNESQIFSSVFREVSQDDSRAIRCEENVKFLINKSEEYSNDVINHPFLDNKLPHVVESLLSKKLV